MAGHNEGRGTVSSSEVIGTNQELQEMKQMLQRVLEHVGRRDLPANIPQSMEMIYQLLLDNEVEEEVAKELITSLLERIGSEDLHNPDHIRVLMTAEIERLLKLPQTITLSRGEGPQVVTLVGPTGVGKTTTIAKLAATFSVVDKRKVALVTADTYRIAAVEQLKTFAEIINVPVEVVFNPQGLRAAIDKHQDKDLILIDTAGRSHRNEAQVEDLKSYMTDNHSHEVYLVMSASTRYKDMVEIVERFSILPLTKILFTKLDETTSFGPILNLVKHTDRSLSYVTIGQNVPDDIEIADPLKLAKMILGERFL